MFGDLARLARLAVTSMGYGGIVGIMVLENLFPPIPSEIVLPLAGYEVSVGNLAFGAALVAATLGALIGALILYALGRYGGRRVVLRLGVVLRVGEAELDRSQAWFARWGDWVVLVARMIPLGRSVVSLPAGMMRMPLGRFALLTTIGSLAWNALLIGAGYALGERWQEISKVVSRYSEVAVALLVLGTVVGSYLLVRRRVRVGVGPSDDASS